MNNGSMAGRELILLAVLLGTLGSGSPAFAQRTGTIRGLVTSSVTGEPLGGVVVWLGDSIMAARTGQDGRFVLREVPPGKASLRMEFLPDFITTTEALDVHAGETIQMDLALVPVAVFLDEILVKGEPSGLGGVVRRYDEVDALALAAKGTVVDLLTEGFPGVEVFRGSGQVGTASKILIRGAKSLSIPGDPLVYLDGIRIDDPSEGGGTVNPGVVGILETVPAATVKRIEILKGPAASRFGIGANNGVILIWTRRGSTPASPTVCPRHLPNPD